MAFADALPDELLYLITAFLPSQPVTLRSKAYLVLSSFCQGVRSSSPPAKKDESDPGTESLAKVFKPLIVSRLEGQKEEDVLTGISFLTALFQVDWQTASSILLLDGIIDLVADIHDLFPSSQLSLEVAHLFGQAGGHKLCRAAMSSQSLEWLESKSRQITDTALRAAAAIALVKLSRGAAADAVDNTNPQEQVGLAQDEELAKLMKGIVVTGDDQSSLSDAIEGLVYLTVDPVIKEELSKDSKFLSRLFALVPRRKGPSHPTKEMNTTLLYGILVIIANVCAYRPRLSEEDAQVDKLRRMAKAGKEAGNQGAKLDILDDDPHVKQRCRKLIACGALDVLAARPATESHGIRVSAGKAFLSFVEDQENRGKVLQSGGARALMQIIRQALSTSSSSEPMQPTKSRPLDVTDLDPIQALAKLAITASPVQVFGPNEGAVYDAIRPFSLMLLHPSSTLLQRFEAIMALTNLSSLGPEAASRVAKADGLMNKVELLLLEQHPLVRRAAMELICNLVAGSEEVFERYSGAEDSRGSKSKIQIILALSDVDDLPTRLAASGALATLTTAPSACRALFDLQRERQRVLPILTQLIDPSVVPSLEGDEEDKETREVESNPGLIHRGVICTRNFLLGVTDVAARKQLSAEAMSAGLVRSLTKIVKGEFGVVDPAVGIPTAELLKWLMEYYLDNCILHVGTLLRNSTSRCAYIIDRFRQLLAFHHYRIALSSSLTVLIVVVGSMVSRHIFISISAAKLSQAPSKKAGKKVAPAKTGGGGRNKVAKADWKEGFKKKQVGVSDMTLLTTISNESINENLQKRWTNAEIYTYIGSVLISVNPFRDLGIYTDEVLRRYKGKNRLEVPPHVFSIAEGAYYNMNAYHENQCVIISGESGAGKTEAAKRIMQYIAAVSGGQDSSIQEIKDMVLATNPLLESFGCAKTLRNNNSSRHGKYLEIMFNSHGEPVGAQITNYLLEKGRVVGQIENERNFHIFYQFTKGASDDQRETFGLQGPEAYAYTSLSNCLEVSDIDDVKDYRDTISAMQTIGLTAHEQNEIFRMLAIVLWLGNVQFEEKDDGNSQIADSSVTDFVAYLMGVDSALVQKVLTSKVVETQRGGRRGSIYDVPLNPAQAGSGRDALAKAIYNNLFEWIVSRVNVSMKPRTATAQVVGILDIFGFEIFEDNSFEQLCINYVNEKLQQIFIELTLKTEQEEYVREQIKWTPIKYFNNKIVCDLIEEKRPPGIFAALNDACATAHADPSAADNSFVQRTSMLASNAHFEARGSQFLVKHYAGDVMYNVAGMTDKNKDALVKDLLDLVAGSGNQFLLTLFPDRVDPNSKKRPPTAGDRIKTSAGALVDNLMKARPSYIRTIKPNQNRSSSEYDSKAILHQIKYLGLQENIRVRRAGFAYRNTFEKMVERFYLLSPATSYAGEYTWTGDARSGCQQILKDTGIAADEWQMGVTKAFIKNPETLFALETMRDRYWHNMAGRIQRAFRNYMRYKHECARRIQRFWKNNAESIQYAQIRDYGHQILAGRKERRRFSLLSYRRFMGDYLDVNGSSPLGEELNSLCGLGAEPAAFSCRIQLLVSKFGRSSKPTPRILVLSSKAVHFVVTNQTDGRIQMSLERKIPLVTIKSIAMTNLRDDWMCLNANASEEGDPIFHCYFKTELAAKLLQLTQASISLMIGPTIDYSKKKDKKAQIKAIKDETIKKDDMYKSHAIHVPSGEPPSSTSRPPAKRKPGIVRPITSGKLLKAGGPSQKPKSATRPKPVAQPLPGKSVASQAFSSPAPASGNAVRQPPPAPKRESMPPPPPAEPDVPMYKAKFAFEGQEGEMTLVKDELYELIEKDDNGWWLIKKDNEEGWAPNNYLELVPLKPKAIVTPPPPPNRRPPPSTPAATPIAPKPTSAPTSVAKVPIKSVAANSSAKPVSVFPGMAPSNGSATPWKKAPGVSNGSSDSTPPSSRPSSSVGGRPPPPVANKPKPPPVAAKPGAPPKPPVAKPAGGKPPVSTAARPGGGAPKPGGAVGQMDLAAALAKRAQKIAEDE
ncbi:hypothetical protein PILCRDRAFT_3023 [Piloderma croceum F 1598]|uniref:Myosin-1 n=1 Tax=Piloderma croceum (strain F 1598) TaxID=765440 RepID=A0A0C3FX78_PILCF|nr:hypothetical protein PILCRDRAFT_3023 [Piloderma croceum F 1598]